MLPQLHVISRVRSVNDKVYFAGFLLAAGLLLFVGRNLLQSSALLVWGLTFAGTTAVAVLGVSLYRLQAALRASHHELARKEAELDFALEVQRALFPDQLPQGRGLELAAACVPARGISGDFYDVLQLPDGRLVFAIADISGKGVSAAILMASLQAVLRTSVEIVRSPSEVCSKLNQHLYKVTEESRFATLFYGEWHPNERRLIYVNAGHAVPVLLPSGRGQRLDKGGFPLGIFASSEYQAGEVSLRPKDMLVLYSDGITEAATADGREFGVERLEAVVSAHQEQPVAEIEARVFEAVRSWSGQEPEDDMTLVIMRVTEAHGENA